MEVDQILQLCAVGELNFLGVKRLGAVCELLSQSNIGSVHTGYPLFLGGILDNRFQSGELVLQLAVVDLGLQLSESRVDLLKGL